MPVPPLLLLAAFAFAQDQPPTGLQICPLRTVAIGAVCMDKYEAPNDAGKKPLVFKTAGEGEAWCAERGKRLCTEAEWVRACEGPSKRPYPYGADYKKGACNDDKIWRVVDWAKLARYPASDAVDYAASLDQSEPSGHRWDCVSEEGVHDLTGNVAEWVRRSFPNRRNYPHVLKGCYWAGCFGGSAPSCAFVNPEHPGQFRTYEAGFRCCKDR